MRIGMRNFVHAFYAVRAAQHRSAGVVSTGVSRNDSFVMRDARLTILSH